MKTMLEENKRRIDERLAAGLARLRETYCVEACPVDAALSDPVIGGRPHHAERYDIAGVGNLLVMTVKEAEANQLSSFVLMPYAKNLPLFSTDYVYAGERRFFLMEIYDLSVHHDAAYDAGIDAFRRFGETLSALPDFPTRSAWYDGIRPVCWAKTYAPEQDDFALERFLAFLDLFVSMEQAAPVLTGDALAEKWEKNKTYADQLIDAGGVSTDLFTEALGAENTRRFFHEVFFGAKWYKPQPSRMQQIDAFLNWRDASGVSNREKIQTNQKVIRRVATTDKDKSYEASDAPAEDGAYPAGVVLQDGKLIGFGIHIYNEDIYPLQSFEIYLRSCGLGGPVDLSGFGDLLFVDLYHNEIAALDVSGDGSLRILGVQDNRIQSLDVRDLKACQGIDAGKNRISALDVSHNAELVELYINDNAFETIDLTHNPKLKYFYCHNNRITSLDVTANPLLRHLDATGNPMQRIRALAPQRPEPLPLELTAEGSGTVGLKFNPVYNAQWKETGEWRQTYFAYPDAGAAFAGWYDQSGALLSAEPVWQDAYGSSRVLTARFEEAAVPANQKTERS